MVWAIKIAVAGVLLWAGLRAYRMFQTGHIEAFDTDGPFLVFARRERPFAYWSFVVLFYAVLLAIAVGAVLL